MNDNLKENQIVDQAKKEMTSATRKPTPPTSVSIMVQVLRVVFSSIPTRLLTSQKPESLKWEQTVEPPAIAAVTQARYSGLSSLCQLLLYNTIPARLKLPTTSICSLFGNISKRSHSRRRRSISSSVAFRAAIAAMPGSMGVSRM